MMACNCQDIFVPELLTFLLVSLGFVFTVIFTGGLSPTSMLAEFLTLIDSESLDVFLRLYTGSGETA